MGLLLGLFTMLTSFAIPVFLAQPATVDAASIPAGCPGSPFAGPPGPGVCESIPLGCPGSTLQGPPAPGFDRSTCPYQTSESMPEPTYREDDCQADAGGDLNAENCGIIGYITLFIQVLSGLAGVVIAGSIIYGGIQYSAAGSDPQKVSAAKARIRNAIIALVFFVFGLGFLNWLVPGGVL